MSNCSVNRFSIIKGMDNTFTFRIKQTGTTLPMEIVSSDTFTAKLASLDGEHEQVVDLVVADMLNGQLKLTIPADDTLDLIEDKGEKVDLYYSRPTYRLLIDCKTENNGDFIAKIPLVYVE